MDKKVLCICWGAHNRSPYLADFLKEKGYNAGYAGLSPVDKSNRITQKTIDESDVLITLYPDISKALKDEFNIKEKRLIELEVQDVDFHLRTEEDVYKDIDRAIKKYLPIKF
ncbi:MAG: hypothetical protein KJ767_00510 [Nanoarchaeota archaeon]|nr:hypothetical protein [Nanoarchaeota archaeon]